MRVLQKAGLVQLEEGDTPAEPSPESVRHGVDAGIGPGSDGALEQSDAGPDTGPARGPAANTAAPDATTGIAEQRPFEDIYASQSVAASPFTAEKLLRILDGLAALDPPARKAAVLALDAADDAWSIDDALLDAQHKSKALRSAKLQLEDQARAALASAKAQIEEQERRQQGTVATIRKQIAELEALLEREVTRATEAKVALGNMATGAKEACLRETARLDVEIVRLSRIAEVFAPADTGTRREA